MWLVEHGGNDGVWLLGLGDLGKHKSPHCLLDHLLCGKSTTCCTDTQAVLWAVIQLRTEVSYQQPAHICQFRHCNSSLEVEPPVPVMPSDDCSPGQHLDWKPNEKHPPAKHSTKLFLIPHRNCER